MRTFLILLLLLVSSALLAFSNPVISNVIASQRADGSDIIDIWYNLYDADGDLCEVMLLLSENGGASYGIVPSTPNLNGDIGENQVSGSNKHIVWNAGAEGFALDGSQYCFKVLAEDGATIPENFIWVAGGTFNNGSSDVTISSFFLDKFEVTQASYQAVTGTNPSINFGIGPNYPVYYINWFRAIGYCNLRSIQEGLSPCYTYSIFGTDPADWPDGWESMADHMNFSCDWTANGYRLPTEMEWQFAARGGIYSQGYTYSGGDDPGQVGWYNGNSSTATHPVGAKLPNELGIFDMSGNVFEWCWDIYGSYPTTPQTDPHGAASGTLRILRGGSFLMDVLYCQVGYRYFNSPSGGSQVTGFRVLRTSP